MYSKLQKLTHCRRLLTIFRRLDFNFWRDTVFFWKARICPMVASRKNVGTFYVLEQHNIPITLASKQAVMGRFQLVWYGLLAYCARNLLLKLVDRRRQMPATQWCW